MDTPVTHNRFQIKPTPPTRILSLRFTARSHLHFAQACAEIRAAAQQHGLRGVGYPIQIVYASRYREDDIDTAFAIPIADSWTDDLVLPTFGRMSVGELPAVQAAVYTHSGALVTLNDARPALEKWVTAQGYRLSETIRIIYLRGLVLSLPVEEWTFEIQHPLTQE